MGYDMYTINKPEGEAERHEAAVLEWHRAIEARDAYATEHPDETGSYTEEEIKTRRTGFVQESPPDNASKEYKVLHAEAEEAYTAMYATETSYFRFNMFNMGRAYDVMRALGMIAQTSDFTPSPWPERPADDDGYYDWEESLGRPVEEGAVSKWDAETLADFERYRKGVEAKLSEGPEPATGIPGWKFSSNDGWVVRPDELRAALATYEDIEEHDPDIDRIEMVCNHAGMDPARWLEWIDYLRRAIDLGGFAVH